MHRTVRRHLGKVVAAAAIAVTGTAVMAGVTLPGAAGAADGPSDGLKRGQQEGQAGRGQAVAPGIAEEAPAEAETGTGRDPLTDAELKRAERIALDRGLRMSSKDVAGDRGPQRITTNLAELRPDEVDDAGAPRRAEISYYDYTDDTLVTRTVNLSTGKVEQTETQTEVQPPPSREEAIEAARLLLASPLGDGLKKDYKDATSRALTSPDQLTLSGGVYRVNAENPGPPALADCGQHRCVRLFTKVKNGPWIDTRTLIVDLSARTAGRLR
ncbi:Tat pathway signal sequence domain protein [Streptomyces sp. A3M-1-3]|uniref:Tat pathway signal sequence domain protein n=1 Tax=Streptomyces sp. A3M-1-3 TaxID=2962044 RepID=UPI0020B8078D|nr:Tat pathway signal sequence domain protein [Streptomyces sp. A3M-1-3]MCP3820854.1 Tat pathway signal sequence domain protein [Streptomyces sp. A3M-1-3]